MKTTRNNNISISHTPKKGLKEKNIFDEETREAGDRLESRTPRGEREIEQTERDEMLSRILMNESRTKKRSIEIK